MSSPATITWLAGHELRLGWRDWLSMMTAGRRSRMRTVALALVVFAAFMHLLAWSMVGGYAGTSAHPDKAVLVGVTGTILLSFSLLLSQAMESVTRAFYTRSDLDLILTSPVSARKVFSVRIARIAVSVSLVAIFLASPFINVLAALGGARWLAAYGVVASMGMVAAALAVALTVALFRVIGPRRTRLIAQIVAAVIGAAFVIGLQIAAIVSYGSLSRFAPLQSDWVIAHRARRRELVVVAGARRARRPGGAGAGRLHQRRRARRSDSRVLGAFRRPCAGGGRRLANHRAPTPLVARVPPRLRRAARCVTRNGCCCGAILGWCRRP